MIAALILSSYSATRLPPAIMPASLAAMPRLTNVDEVRLCGPEASTEASGAANPIDPAAWRARLLAADAARN